MAQAVMLMAYSGQEEAELFVVS